MSGPESINFTVDAALLRELGERLVGRPHIAVAELVKNAYDADASLASIRIEHDRIVVEDNGHGMTEAEFRSFWMRIGSAHKVQQGVSRALGRQLTGSKGVGRLAVQFLGRKVAVSTTSNKGGSPELKATVDWSQADKKKDLTAVVALLEKRDAPGSYAASSRHGCRITITELNHNWTDPAQAEELASALWELRSPIPVGTARQRDDFEIMLDSDIPEARDKFQERVQAPLDLWYALIRGELVRKGREHFPSKLKVNLIFKDDDRKPLEYIFDVPRQELRHMSFEVRVYSLYGRQENGIAVQKARAYVAEHGGVKIFDNGFRLPYYGLEHDWLGIERDHSHRLVESQILPEKLKVEGSLRNLPTQTRLLGFVYVNTSLETSGSAEPSRRVDDLQIQVSRDRLVDNGAFQELQHCVRLAIEWYAMRETVRKVRAAEREISSFEKPTEKLKTISQIIHTYEKHLPKGEGRRLLNEIEEVVEIENAGQELLGQNVNLLGALATAGMFALSFEHEIGRQLAMLEGMAKRLSTLGKPGIELGKEFEAWIARVRQTRSIFTALSDEESRQKRQRFLAHEAISQFARQAIPFLGNAEIKIDSLSKELRLPAGSFAEWSAVFQNLFANAANALLDAKRKQIDVSSHSTPSTHNIFVQDTGAGVDLRTADKLFEPFERRTHISAERRAMAVGGTGLGLTIVKTITSNLGCSVSFEKPQRGYSTAIKLTWSR
jgi:signal transduction histidine kinase